MPPFFHTQIKHSAKALAYWHNTLKPHYLSGGAIRRISPPPKGTGHVSKCFFVEKASGGFRLVVDLRFLNEHFEEHKIKFENLSMLQFAHGNLAWGAKLDLSDAYHHLQLHDDMARLM